MKKLIILYIVLLMMPIALAELELEEIRIYVNNERYNDADKDGGDIELEQGDILELMVDLDNNMNNKTEVKLKGVLENIDDGNDIVKEMGWYDIDANDDKTKTLSFAVPGDALKDSYDLELDIDYQYLNGTKGKFEVEWDVIVEKEYEDKEVDLKVVVGNMSSMCTKLIDEMSISFDYIGKYDGCLVNWSTCKEERGTYESQADECERTNTRCQTDLDSCNQDKNELDEKMNLMISKSDCKEDTEKEVREKVAEAEQKKDRTMFGIGIMIAVVAFIWWNKRKKSTIHDKHYQEKIFPR